MKRSFLTATLAAMGASAVLAQTGTAILDHQHVELKIQYNAGDTNHLSISAFNTESQTIYPSNQVLLVVKPPAMTTLPAGTPFGDEGDPIWILPDTPDPVLLTVGYSSEGIPPGVFATPLDFKLKRVQGPGGFFLWQATSFGTLDVKMNSRDGISDADKLTLPVGSHEHYFWGFAATGIYCLTFQSSGTRVGDGVPASSLETTFVFQVQPLPIPTNFLAWQKTEWPPWIPASVIAANSDPDGDGIANLFEYAFNLDPKESNNVTALPLFSFVTNANQRFGALGYTRFKLAGDLTYRVEAASALSDEWTPITNVVNTVPGVSNLTERITIRDTLPVNATPQRFYRLKVLLN